MKIIGIRRGAEYSPNMEKADEAIFEAVATRLETMGHEVVRLTDEEIDELDSHADRIFTMSRDLQTNAMLDIVERLDHTPCVNSGRGISICASRQLLHEQLTDAGIDTPPTWFGSLYAERWENDPADAFSLIDALPYPVWIKRSDGYSTVKGDVTLVQTVEEAQVALMDMAKRSIGEVAFCQHMEGDLVKFYGVAGTGFFNWDYADMGHSKFGLEKANGTPHRYAFDIKQLQQQCERVAMRIGVPVYGGDAIVQSDGRFYVIDFNDWPSFSRCREQAADAICMII